MKSRDTKPGPLAMDNLSQKTTTPGVTPRPPTADDLTDPSVSPNTLRESDEQRAAGGSLGDTLPDRAPGLGDTVPDRVVEPDALDELALAAKVTIMMPERPDSAGARNARYATEGRPARSAMVTVPTGEVLIEPMNDGPGSPLEVIGLLRDSVPTDDAGPDVRDVPSGDVELGMSVESPRRSRQDALTAPSARLVEKREHRKKGGLLMLAGIGAATLLLVVWFVVWMGWGSKPNSTSTGTEPLPTTPTSVTAQTSTPKVIASGAPVTPKVVETAPLAPATVMVVPSAVGLAHPPGTPKKEGPKVEGPQASQTAQSPQTTSSPTLPTKPVVAPVPTDITHNIN